jgi:hypothetical protein
MIAGDAQLFRELKGGGTGNSAIWGSSLNLRLHFIYRHTCNCSSSRNSFQRWNQPVSDIIVIAYGRGKGNNAPSTGMALEFLN